MSFDYEQTTLENGLTICTIPTKATGIDSFINVTLDVGTLLDPYEGSGLAHFIEHMVFKTGGDFENGRELKRHINNVGGSGFNAMTGHGATSYFLKVPVDHLIETSSIFLRSILEADFKEIEFQQEKLVILEEYMKYESDFADKLHLGGYRSLYPNSPFAWNILGEPDELVDLSFDELISFHGNYYRPNRVTLSICGDVKHSDNVDNIASKFGHLTPGSTKKSVSALADIGKVTASFDQIGVTYFGFYFDVPVENLGSDNPNEYKAALLTEILGANSNGFDRMTEHLREDMSLVYQCGSRFKSYISNGYITVNGLTRLENTNKTMTETEQLIKGFAESITEQEATVAKRRIKSVLNTTSAPSSWASSVARDVSAEGTYLDLQEVYDIIDDITKVDLQEFAAEIFSKQPGLSVVSNDKTLKNLPRFEF